MSDTRRPFATLEEFCEYVGISRAQSAQLRYHGTGPQFIKVGRLVRYRWEDVDAWIEQQTKQRTDDRRGAVA